MAVTLTRGEYPWAGDDLPSGNWTLEIPVDLPAGVGIAPLVSDRSLGRYWVVFNWDGAGGVQVLSVHRQLELAFPALAIAVVVAKLTDSLTETDLMGFWEKVGTARTAEEAHSRTREWLEQRFGSADDPLSAAALAAMPTPKVYH